MREFEILRGMCAPLKMGCSENITNPFNAIVAMTVYSAASAVAPAVTKNTALYDIWRALCGVTPPAWDVTERNHCVSNGVSTSSASGVALTRGAPHEK